MKDKISLSQFYILMFISNVLFISYISSDALNNNFADSIISVITAFILGGLLTIPIYKIQETNDKKKITNIFYGFYFIMSDIIILTQVISVFSNTIYYNVSPIILLVALLLTSFYGYKKGIEVISRTAFFVFIIYILAMLFVMLGLVNLFKADNSEILFYDNYTDCIKNAWLIFSASSYLPQMVILKRYIGKKFNYKVFIWQGLACFSIIIIFLAIVFALGRFASTQMYPFYSLFSVAVLEPIQRMDNIFSLITLLFLTIRVSVDLVLIENCFSKFIKKRFSIIIPITSCVVILLVTFCLSELNLVYLTSNLSLLKPIPVILLGFVLPVIEILKSRRKL
ncbi:MAG: hypothetical protein R3Y35_00490 [Clostridia bacterium]